MTSSLSLARLSGLRTVSSAYDVLLCDIWGVVHDGITGFGDAITALQNYRHGGGTVVLITNAPRPAVSVRQQLDKLNIPDDIEDAIVTSGDVTRALITAHGPRKVFHLGPPRDQPLVDGLNITLTGFEDCEMILCSGLYDDEVDDLDDYRDLLTAAAGRTLELVCANPDHVVQRGDKQVYCAGALADLYEQLGGRAVYAGKPHRPIYELALDAAVKPGGARPAHERVLAIGDNLATDIAGAVALGLEALFITGGIHSGDVRTDHGAADTITLDVADDAAGKHIIGYQPALCW